MKKRIWLSFPILAIIMVGIYFSIKLNPPLEIGTLASTADHKAALVEVGNKGFREVNIVDVSVNNHERPSETKIQVSHALQGFIMADDYNSEEAKKYIFVGLNDIALKGGTSPSATLDKLNDGTASENNEIYGVSVIYDKEIDKVHIKYSYLGIPFNETVLFN